MSLFLSNASTQIQTNFPERQRDVGMPTLGSQGTRRGTELEAEVEAAGPQGREAGSRGTRTVLQAARTGLALRGRGLRWVRTPCARTSYLSEDEAGGSGAAIRSFQPAPPGRGASGHLNSTNGATKKPVRTAALSREGIRGWSPPWEPRPGDPSRPSP